jgi:hypothetical protein
MALLKINLPEGVKSSHRIMAFQKNYSTKYLKKKKCSKSTQQDTTGSRNLVDKTEGSLGGSVRF